MASIKETFVAWFSGLSKKPDTTEIWLVGFRILQDLFFAVAMVEYGAQEFDTIATKILAKPSIFDYKRASP